MFVNVRVPIVAPLPVLYVIEVTLKSGSRVIAQRDPADAPAHRALHHKERYEVPFLTCTVTP
jgi:hypothetical protein